MDRQLAQKLSRLANCYYNTLLTAEMERIKCSLTFISDSNIRFDRHLNLTFIGLACSLNTLKAELPSHRNVLLQFYELYEHWGNNVELVLSKGLACISFTIRDICLDDTYEATHFFPWFTFTINLRHHKQVACVGDPETYAGSYCHPNVDSNICLGEAFQTYQTKEGSDAQAPANQRGATA